jgi:hypothetical protein
VEEDQVHSFIVRVWLEETLAEGGKAKWRGHITHVLTGRRRYLQNLSSIPAFMMPYLKQMGVRFGPVARLRLWLDK